MTDILMDPVADGAPSPSKFNYAAMLALLAVATWQLSAGSYSAAVSNVGMAGLVWMIERQKRTYWFNGYYSAASSMQKQAREIKNRDS